jgi:HAD superfamily hydrolase (TIGR01509 family)
MEWLPSNHGWSKLPQPATETLPLPPRMLSVKLIAYNVSTVVAAIFDMDGLLIDTEPIWRRSEIEVFGELGLHLTEEQCMQTMGVRVAEVVELWYSRHPWEGPSCEDVTRRIYASVISHVQSEGEPMRGVLNTLRVVHDRGMPCAVASSSSEILIRAVIEKLNIGRYIGAICSADDEAEGKPHPAVYLTAARRLGVTPERCVAFEDSPNGVLSAKAAGMLCIVVPDPYLAADPRMDRADIRLESLRDFTEETLGRLTAQASNR